MPEDSAQLTAFKRFYDSLIAHGIDEQSAAYLLGRLVNKVTTLAVAQAMQEIGEEKAKQLGTPTKETADQWQANLEDLYLQETGREYLDMFEQVLEDEVANYKD